MRKREGHPLKNFSFGVKIGSTLGLVGGVGLFFGALITSVLLTSWTASIMAVVGWGEHLFRLSTNSPGVFYGLGAVHVVSLATVVAISNRLLQKVAIARGARVALASTAIVLGGVDLGCWILLVHVDWARDVLGVIVLVLGTYLLLLASRLLWEMWVYPRWRTPTGERVRVAIVGGGFAGLYAALDLDAALGYHRDVEIVVIDRKNYFLFPPLLPSVAAGAIETRQVTYPFRRIFEATNIQFRKEHVEHIDANNRVIHALVDLDVDPESGEKSAITSNTSYDYLVLSPGADTNTFGTKGVVDNAFFMRELGDAVAVRNQIIECFERAARESDPDRRGEQLSFVIVGAGPTGVELASEVQELISHVLLTRYPEVAAAAVRVVVVQSAPQILPGWHDAVVSSATKQLGRLNVELMTGARVTEVGPKSVLLKDGTVIPTRTCVWCAGVKPAAVLTKTPFPKDRSGRVEIEADLRVKGFDNAFVLGDSAFLLDKGKPLPPLGQVAFQQGSHAAKNIQRLITGRTPQPFRYFNFGSLVSVGEHFAAIDLLGIRTSGFVAWIIWRMLYLMKLVGFGNKVRVLIDWTLDLLVERSISQISAERQDLAAKGTKTNRGTVRL